jgi:hypothetical protein
LPEYFDDLFLFEDFEFEFEIEERLFCIFHDEIDIGGIGVEMVERDEIVMIK